MLEIDTASAYWKGDRLHFDARGRLVNCAVLQTALVDYAEVADTRAAAEAALTDHADVIRAAVAGKIEREEFDASGDVVIRVADLEGAQH
jgi:hypothetical protein